MAPSLYQRGTHRRAFLDNHSSAGTLRLCHAVQQTDFALACLPALGPLSFHRRRRGVGGWHRLFLMGHSSTGVFRQALFGGHYSTSVLRLRRAFLLLLLALGCRPALGFHLSSSSKRGGWAAPSSYDGALFDGRSSAGTIRQAFFDCAVLSSCCFQLLGVGLRLSFSSLVVVGEGRAGGTVFFRRGTLRQAFLDGHSSVRVLRLRHAFQQWLSALGFCVVAFSRERARESDTLHGRHLSSIYRVSSWVLMIRYDPASTSSSVAVFLRHRRHHRMLSSSAIRASDIVVIMPLHFLLLCDVVIGRRHLHVLLAVSSCFLHAGSCRLDELPSP